MSAHLHIGDPVEVARPTKGGKAFEWIPGTICALSDDSIGIAFADGTRKAFPVGTLVTR